MSLIAKLCQTRTSANWIQIRYTAKRTQKEESPRISCLHKTIRGPPVHILGSCISSELVKLVSISSTKVRINKDLLKLTIYNSSFIASFGRNETSFRHKGTCSKNVIIIPFWTLNMNPRRIFSKHKSAWYTNEIKNAYTLGICTLTANDWERHYRQQSAMLYEIVIDNVIDNYSHRIIWLNETRILNFVQISCNKPLKYLLTTVVNSNKYCDWWSKVPGVECLGKIFDRLCLGPSSYHEILLTSGQFCTYLASVDCRGELINIYRW